MSNPAAHGAQAPGRRRWNMLVLQAFFRPHGDDGTPVSPAARVPPASPLRIWPPPAASLGWRAMRRARRRMRVLLQRVSRAAVAVDGAERGAVGRGFLALVGVTHEDDVAAARKLAAKTARLRVFADDAGLMNLALGDVGGAVLAVSQFTLYADTRRGNRPSFTDAAPPDAGRGRLRGLRRGAARRGRAGRDRRVRRAHAGRAGQRRSGDDPAGGLSRGHADGPVAARRTSARAACRRPGRLRHAA